MYFLQVVFFYLSNGQLCKLYSNSIIHIFHLYDLQDLMFIFNPMNHVYPSSRQSLVWYLFKYPARGIAQSWKDHIYLMRAITFISSFEPFLPAYC